MVNESTALAVNSRSDVMLKTKPRVEPQGSAQQEAEQAQRLVAECGEQLASVNADLVHEAADPQTSSGVKSALHKNQSVEKKVATALDKVVAVRSALTVQQRDRRMLDHQFAAAIEQEAAARHTALHDVLTGLPNRALLDDRLEHGLEQAKRHGWSIAVMFIDLNAFKRINDELGHAVGDRVLQTVAQRLTENTRSVDTVSRYGGDEFVYLLTEIKSEVDVAQVAEKLVSALRAPWQEYGNSPTSPVIVASIGIAVFPQHGVTADALLRSADSAMYQAKQSSSGYAFAL